VASLTREVCGPVSSSGARARRGRRGGLSSLRPLLVAARPSPSLHCDRQQQLTWAPVFERSCPCDLLLMFDVSLCAACVARRARLPPRGQPAGAKVTMTVGASGGPVTSGDGASVSSSPGALRLRHGRRRPSHHQHGPLGRGPVPAHARRAQFLKPVKLTFKFTAATTSGPRRRRSASVSDEAGLWHTWTQNTATTTAGTITRDDALHRRHAAVGWQLVPSSDVAAARQLDLKLKYCEPEQASEPAESCRASRRAVTSRTPSCRRLVTVVTGR